MTSSINNNRCKLLVLDLDIKQTSIDDLRTFFSSYGPVEWIETFPESSSVIIYFISYLIVDHLVNYRTCIIGQSVVRLRRFRLDQNNWHFDSCTLYIKLTTSPYSNSVLTEVALRYCFRDYLPYINKLDIINENNALVSFSHYDYVDQIILMPSTMFIIDDVPLVFERIIEKVNKKSRWDQSSAPLTTKPILSVRDPVVHKLISHIEYLTKQLREQPSHSQNKIERLEAEVFILKNENAELKSKFELKSTKNIEQRLKVLEDVSNRLVNKQYDLNRRERSNNNEKQPKRRRSYKIHDDFSNSP
ncbi:unnamed protein product [Rotaria sp. Silwood2]|nr:unnamed protein product [Rotaria sp. Silwood2]CAF2982399.1 unnamed protein product [Rotaria sp. Silwood2]CAF3211341.1 unnamed protein product [Rotaria sp. Silwood2]CAF3325697.1 unnamed protein product [Rotaria sp. Silwood2]CAF3966983.1 unnamed protein product [Rotaria sp. Silwood2]